MGVETGEKNEREGTSEWKREREERAEERKHGRVVPDFVFCNSYLMDFMKRIYCRCYNIV